MKNLRRGNHKGKEPLGRWQEKRRVEVQKTTKEKTTCQQCQMLSKNKMTTAHCLKKLEVSGISTGNNLCRVYSGNGVAEHKLQRESEQVRKKSEEEEVNTGNSFNMFYCEREKKGNWWKMMVESCWFVSLIWKKFEQFAS